jgi:molybdenum-dependent DNA-binding transcriptional regulator ModE
MAKSKVRGGAKAHRAKIAARNQKLKSAQSAMEKLFNEAMKKEIEALKAKRDEEETTLENTEQ